MTYGFYPLTGLPVGPGVVKADKGKVLNTFTIKTTPAQDKIVQQYIQKNIARPPKYNFFTHACTDFVTGALNAAGISVPSYQSPKVLAQWFVQNYGGKACGR